METKFKCKDEVIYRYDNSCMWQYGIFSHYEEEHICLVGAKLTAKWQILPYKGNKHLVGTYDTPVQEERLLKGEVIVVSDELNTLEKGFGEIGVLECVTGVDEMEMVEFRFCIRLSDLTSPDRKDKIMRVDNGKIVKVLKQ